MSPVIPRPVGPDDRLEWIADDDGVLAAQPDARAPIPSEFHPPDSDTALSIGAFGGARRLR